MKVICKYCEATGESKCPNMRNVFPDNLMDAVMSHLIKSTFEVEALPDGQKRIIFTIRTFDIVKDGVNEDGKPSLDFMEGMWRGLARQLEGMLHAGPGSSSPTLRQWACDHEWEHTQNCTFCGFKPKGD